MPSLRTPFAAALLGLAALFSAPSHAQTAPDPGDEAPFGAWYMYFGTAQVGDGPFGAHAEVQYRNHDVVGDLQQLLLRTSGRYTLPDGSTTLSLGYGYILNEQEGEPDNGVSENRLYQEAFLRQRVQTIRVNHRFRYEQRFVDDLDAQTRFRYAIFASLPLTSTDMSPGTVYAAAYNEIFLNTSGRERDGVDIPVFGNNRLYGALGYQITGGLAVQVGYMNQTFGRNTDDGFRQREDGQLQFSLHHNFGL